MSSLINAIVLWWHDFGRLLGHEYNTMNPEKYSTLLIIVFVGGYLMLKGANRR